MHGFCRHHGSLAGLWEAAQKGWFLEAEHRGSVSQSAPPSQWT